ncbi:hypothetical protein ACJ73_01786 [Blastomyces percursus]|uniref:Uncharacterized protein n=1 Tax=Blastomyces percursus TaxID=1658174 RepID=A0A1J9R333_9EURO|nr:hypothetical protein ACJ73_01786 [Blastomyces percursus]
MTKALVLMPGPRDNVLLDRNRLKLSDFDSTERTRNDRMQYRPLLDVRRQKESTASHKGA